MIEPVVILVPVLGRPHRVVPTMESVQASTPEPHRLLFVAQADDTDELAALESAGADHIVVARSRRSYAKKINDGYRASDEPLVFMAADDLAFHDGWNARAQALLKPGVDVVGTNDICNPRVMTGQHSTHTLVRRSYVEGRSGVVDTPGTVLCELYDHEFCDDEFVQTAMSRGVYAHAFDAIVEHLHPNVDKAPDDPTYQLGRRKTSSSRQTFIRRRHLWRREAART